MQALFSEVSFRLTELRLRPMLVVAGAAAATAGAYYLLTRTGDRQRGPTAVDAATVTDSEGPVLPEPNSAPQLQPTSVPLVLPHAPFQAQPSSLPLASPSPPPQHQLASPAWAEPHSPPCAQQNSPYQAELSSSPWPCSPAELHPTSPSRVESTLPPQPEPSSPLHSQEPPCPQLSTASIDDSALETAGESDSQACEVPALYNYFMAKRITNFPLRLTALRLAFDRILSRQQCRNFVSVAGRTILAGLASLNSRNLTVFEEAYNRLLLVARNPVSQEVIEAELAEIGIHRFNFIDVVYELFLLGVLGGARPPILATPGGFLGHLMTLLLSFSTLTMQSTPRANYYLFLLQDETMLFLDDIFSLEECVYLHGPLDVVVWESLLLHVRQLSERLKPS